jgi:hemerythrin
MSLFKWNSAHTIFLSEIDAEHRAIYRLGDELHKALLAGAKTAQLQPILVSLLESAEEHFRHEERLMRAAHYQSMDWHKRQHDAARSRVKTLAKRIADGDTAAAPELLAFLSDWLRDHMAVADRMMGASLRNYMRAHASLAS